jgi:hypothetical protein
MRKKVVIFAAIGLFLMASSLFVATVKWHLLSFPFHKTDLITSASSSGATHAGIAGNFLSSAERNPSSLSNASRASKIVAENDDNSAGVAPSAPSNKKSLPIIMEIKKNGNTSQVEVDKKSSLIVANDGSDLVYSEDGKTVYHVKKLSK